MMKKSLLPLFFLVIAAAPAWADDDQVCFSGATKNLEASVKACTAILQRPLLTPEWKLRALKTRGFYHEHQHRFDLAFYVTTGKFREALKENGVLMRMFPDDSRILNNNCWIHAALWEMNAALADCNRSLALAPRAVETLDSRGFVYLRMHNYKQALADYNAALAIDPAHSTSLYVRGVTKRKLGDLTGGNADITAAGKLNPEVAESFAPYGLTQGN